MKLPLCVGDIMKKILRIVCIILIMILLVVGALLGYLTVDEYNPDEVEAIAIEGDSQEVVARNTPIKLLSWNIGYGALGDNADFFMDGGHMVYTADKDRVESNLKGIISVVEQNDPDFFCVQELDRNSDRSYFIDESDFFKKNSDAAVFAGDSAFAANFKVALVPLPIPPIGKVLAGLETFSRYSMDQADRLRLPSPFSWPLRTFNLKRCLEVSRFTVEDSDKELVIINLHLEAYDSGEGKIAQANMLRDTMKQELDKGNYVIACGDFNQIFSNLDTSFVPVHDGMWEPGVINVDEFDSRLSFFADDKVPSCRSLDRPLDTAESRDPSAFQFYIIDGVITSSNITVDSVHTQDHSFVNSDHNPVIMEFSLQ